MPTFTVGQAAELLGVSADSVRRLIDAGQIDAVRDPAGRRRVDGAALARFCTERAEASGSTDPTLTASARNHFTGLVTKVVRDTVMAQVEIQAGPFRVVSLISREAADQLELAPGVLAVASVKSTNVGIEIPKP